MDGPKFVIQGIEYPVPEWISFTMSESEILYDKAKLTLDQADDDLVFTPGLLSALMLIAYMRGNPGISRKAAEKLIGDIPLAEAVEHLAGSEEEANPPSAGPSENPPHAEPARNDESGSSTGTNGGNGSVNPAVVQLPTGTHELGTSRTYDQATSAS